MKKTFFLRLISTLLIFATLLTGCNEPDDPASKPHEHVWEAATCSSPKTCKDCGATEGETLTHEWAEATYSAPKTCTLCGLTEGEKLECPIPEHLNLALAIDKIPIAKQGMTEDELRDIVVQYMYLQINFAYTPDLGNLTEYKYYIKNLHNGYGFEGCQIPFEEGKYYGGIPYMGNAAGSLYRWLEYYDADSGVMDWEPFIRTRRKNWKDESTGVVYPDVGSAIFGNTCAASCVWAWLRVSNSVTGFWTTTWVPSRGYVKVGEYELTKNNNHGSETKDLCDANGREVMFEAYAQVKRADGLLKSGHATMSVSDAVVVRDSEGRIDGNASYVLIAEQTSLFLTATPDKGGVPLYSPLGDKGLTYRIQGNFSGNIVNGKVKEMKRSFEYLFKQGYLPFTVPELVGKSLIERTRIGLYDAENEAYKEKVIKASELKGMTIQSNYAISDIHFIIRDENGNELFNSMYAFVANDVTSLMTFTMKGALLDNPLYANGGHINVAVWDHAASGKNTLEITARVSTGELISVYKGTLTE